MASFELGDNSDKFRALLCWARSLASYLISSYLDVKVYTR